VRIVSGSLTKSLELETASLTGRESSTGTSRWHVPFDPGTRRFGAQEIPCARTADDKRAGLVGGAEIIANSCALLTPFKVAETAMYPDTSALAVAKKVAVSVPSGTITASVSAIARLLLEILTVTFPDFFDSVTVQVALAPKLSLVVLHVNADKAGMDQSASFALWEEDPSFAVTDPVVSDVMLPPDTLNAIMKLPAGTNIVKGTLRRLEEELTAIVVSLGAGCERETVHMVVPPGRTPLALHPSDVISTPAVRETVVACEAPL
jgi:hypothetical protein